MGIETLDDLAHIIGNRPGEGAEGLSDLEREMVALTTPRRALVTSSDSLKAVQQYLPANYEAFEYGPEKHIWIEGHDDHGWTLDGYVLPRLASGLIVAREVKA